jgi:hypothetical protein
VKRVGTLLFAAPTPNTNKSKSCGSALSFYCCYDHLCASGIFVFTNTRDPRYDFAPISVVAIAANVRSAAKCYQFIGRGVRRVREKTAAETLVEPDDTPCTVLYSARFPAVPKLIQSCIDESWVPLCDDDEDEPDAMVE